MQELDVNKPMQYRKNQNSKIRFVSYIIKNGMKKILLIETMSYGEEFTRVVGLNGSWLNNGETHDCDIINVPEKPAFSWDKPIRHIATGGICVFKHREKSESIYPWFLVFKNKNGIHWASYYTDEAMFHVGDDIPSLENYEPEY